MSEANHPLKVEELRQLSSEKLADIVIAQQKLIKKLQTRIEKLEQSLNLDSQTSSKPPSSDLLKKSEKETEVSSEERKQLIRKKPGGQPGHQGKTRKGFGRVDRYEVLKPNSMGIEQVVLDNSEGMKSYYQWDITNLSFKGYFLDGDLTKLKIVNIPSIEELENMRDNQ